LIKFDSEYVLLDHGSGGLLSHQLVTELIAPELGAVHIGLMQDSRILESPFKMFAVTTDSFIVDPLFLGNCNIGHIAVCGTVNDLAVSGAKPLYLTLALVIEEGFAISDLTRILHGVRDAATEANVAIVAGDTKVMRRGEIDKLLINTAGIGRVDNIELCPSVDLIRPGDKIIVTGFLGNDGVHVLSLRHGLGFEQRVQSDCAPLNHLIQNMLTMFGAEVHFIRDITRGGLGTLLNEVSASSRLAIEIDEAKLPLQDETVMLTDMIGVSPLYLANEGNLCIIVNHEIADSCLASIRNEPYGGNSRLIGTVQGSGGNVVMKTKTGQLICVDYLLGQPLARLC
jgi:hydrogenase expression/formation protein HypE